MSQDGTELISKLARAARDATGALRVASTGAKNDALRRFASLIRADTRSLEAANARDVDSAADQSKAFRDRLTLTPERVEAMAAAVEVVASLPDPIGETIQAWRRPNGIEIAQVRVPLGVIGVIYDASSRALRSCCAEDRRPSRRTAPSPRSPGERSTTRACRASRSSSSRPPTGAPSMRC
jgi:glutamate-5-semialdehyde dehydrogenase